VDYRTGSPDVGRGGLWDRNATKFRKVIERNDSRCGSRSARRDQASGRGPHAEPRADGRARSRASEGDGTLPLRYAPARAITTRREKHFSPLLFDPWFGPTCSERRLKSETSGRFRPYFSSAARQLSPPILRFGGASPASGPKAYHAPPWGFRGRRPQRFLAPSTRRSVETMARSWMAWPIGPPSSKASISKQ